VAPSVIDRPCEWLASSANIGLNWFKLVCPKLVSANVMFLSRVNDIAILSVRPSVHPSHADIR